MVKVVLATKNVKKARDMEHLLHALPIEIVSLGAEVEDVEETGTTFEENAILKARAAAQATGLPAIGDDSGLEVDALDGAPGVYAARFAKLAGRGEGDAANNELLLERLGATARRTARFRSVLAFVDGDTLLLGRGVCEGVILHAPRGDGGFGYDPLFYCPELSRTFGEAPIEEKATISHRARAAADLAPALLAHLGEKP